MADQMSQAPDESPVVLASKLARIDCALASALAGGTVGKDDPLLAGYYSLRNSLSIALAKSETLTVQDRQLRKDLARLRAWETAVDVWFQRNDPLFYEKMQRLTDDECYEMISEILPVEDYEYPDNFHRQLASGLLEVKALLLGVSVPKRFNWIVREIRECYAFGAHGAVWALLRTALEIAIRDVATRRGVLAKPSAGVADIGEYQPSRLINEVARGELRTRMRDLYRQTSDVLHGRKDWIGQNAAILIGAVFRTIEELYEQSGY